MPPRGGQGHPEGGGQEGTTARLFHYKNNHINNIQNKNIKYRSFLKVVFFILRDTADFILFYFVHFLSQKLHEENIKALIIHEYF